MLHHQMGWSEEGGRLSGTPWCAGWFLWLSHDSEYVGIRTQRLTAETRVLLWWDYCWFGHRGAGRHYGDLSMDAGSV